MYINNTGGSIQLTPTDSYISALTESAFSLNVIKENHTNLCDTLYTEAVFNNGKKKLEPLEELFQKLKDELESEITATKDAKETKNKFNPDKYWKNPLWRQVEDFMYKTFGFRVASVNPYREKYNNADDNFESKELNAFVFRNGRYPIEGLITNDGFYDKSKSLNFECFISLGLIRALTAEEIVAVLIHEFGHAIDPALVDIKYVNANILSKYITDRKGALNEDEKKALEKQNLTLSGLGVGALIIGLLAGLAAGVVKVIDCIKNAFKGQGKFEEEKLELIKKELNNQKEVFNRQTYTEAFADNFARMYGYGAILMGALKKVGADEDAKHLSRYNKEKQRVEEITNIALDMIKNDHKTDIHRIRNLLSEYEKDLKDPNVPKTVKKQLQDDKDELEKLLNEYMNNYSDFQNRVNRLINEELQKQEESSTKKSESPKTDKPKENKSTEKKDKDELVKEGYIFIESRKAYEELMEAKEYLNTEERAEAKKRFGNVGCTFSKDKDGYYCFTHRARSKSYPSIKDIPQKDVDFIDSTC